MATEDAAEELDTDTVSASAFEVIEDVVIAAAEPVTPLTDAAVAADIDNTAVSPNTEFCFKPNRIGTGKADADG